MADKKTEQTVEEVLWAKIQKGLGVLDRQIKHFDSMMDRAAVNVADFLEETDADGIASRKEAYAEYLDCKAQKRAYTYAADAIREAIS